MKQNHSKPNPLDLVEIDEFLSADEKAVRDAVRQVCDKSVDPYVADWFERGELPVARELAKELGALGLLGMHLEGYGCAGMSAVDYGLACLELEAPTPASGPWCPCRGRWRCSRSGASAPRSRSRSGCRAWPPARRSAASA